MRFFKSTLITFFANIFIFSISIIITIVTSRGLGPTGKGILSVSNNLVSMSIITLGLGIAASNIFFIGRNKKDLNSILGINIIVAFFSVFVLIILYFINMRYPINFLFKGLTNKIIIIVFITIPLMNLKTCLINVLLGLQEIKKYNKINIIDIIVSFSLLLIFITIFKSVEWIIIGNLIAVTIMLIILFTLFFYKNRYKVSFNFELFKDMLKYGIKAQIGNAVQFLNYRLDVIIINYLLPIAQVGIYSNAVALSETMWRVSGTVSTIVLPMTTNSKDKKVMSSFINRITRITFTLILMCSVVLVIISKPLIFILLGKDFSGSAGALILLIPGISIFSVCNILSSYIAGIGQIGKNIIASSVSCIATVILDFLLIPKMGINGASIATSVSYIMATAITLFFYIRITDSKLVDILIIKMEDILEIKLRLKKVLDKYRSHK